MSRVSPGHGNDGGLGQTGNMQITHLGHSCVLLETAGQRILVDPATSAPPGVG